MFNEIPYNVNYSLPSQLLSCDSVNEGDDVNDGKMYKNINDVHTSQTNTLQYDHEKQIEKATYSNPKKELEQTQILIAESENELLILFREYLTALGVNIDTVDRGDEALERILERKDKEKFYDAIIVDTHLNNPSGLDVVKRIRSEKPDQKIVLITTTQKENLSKECLKTAGIEDKYILTMPFRLSKLMSVITKSLLT